MGRIRTRMLLAALGVLFGSSMFFDRAGTQISAPILASQNILDAKTLQTGLAKENWDFEPIDPANLQAAGVTQKVITKQQAIDQVYAHAPLLRSAPGITGLTANLGKLASLTIQASAQAGEPVDPTFLTPRLVWVVTLAGLQQQSAGPPGTGTSNELDVVIDAITGEQLMSFVWTR